MCKSMFARLMVMSGVVVMVGAMALPAAADDHNAAKLEREAISLIEDVEEVGRDVEYHAERLKLFLAGGIDASRWTHFHHLDQIKWLVNDRLRPALVRLDELELILPEWKQDSVARMIAAAQVVARDASSAFTSKNTSPTTLPVLNAEYRTLVANMVTHAGTLVTTADAAHTYATAHLKATEAGLGVPR